MAALTGRPLPKQQTNSRKDTHTEPLSQARRDEEDEMEKQARIERRRAVNAINKVDAPPQGSVRKKVRWAVSIVESVGLSLNKKGLRELQKRVHPDKNAEADRADAHKAFQRLDHVEEGLRNGGFL